MVPVSRVLGRTSFCEDPIMTDTPAKKPVEFRDYPASRPGLITYTVIFLLVVLYIGVAHGDGVKAMFGL